MPRTDSAPATIAPLVIDLGGTNSIFLFDHFAHDLDQASRVLPGHALGYSHIEILGGSGYHQERQIMLAPGSHRYIYVLPQLPHAAWRGSVF